jgi:hypothetical protein
MNMATANRPVFVPQASDLPLIKEVVIEFEWFSGFAVSQIQKSIAALHIAAKASGITPILEISSKSNISLGVSLSAFNLNLEAPGEKKISVESAFQGSKIFQKGGPYTDLYFVSSKEAKQDPRLKNSGDIVGFQYFGEDFPILPKTAFYDWLYITALLENPGLSYGLDLYKGFTDIAFNPKKSVNCQARSAALFLALKQQGIIEHAVGDCKYFLSLLENRLRSDTQDNEPCEQLGL